MVPKLLDDAATVLSLSLGFLRVYVLLLTMESSALFYFVLFVCSVS